MLYQYSDTVFAIKQLNTAKDGEAFLFISYSYRIVSCNMCVSHIRYLFICSAAKLRRLSHRALKLAAWFGL